MLLVCVFPDWVSADVLVATHRVVARFGELTSDEVADLFQCAHRIAPVLQSAFNATALTLALQVYIHTHHTHCASHNSSLEGAMKLNFVPFCSS